LLLWFQPWFLEWSGEPSMTEMPFTLMLVLSALLFVSQRFMLASMVIGFFPLVRIEAIALTALWVGVCALRRDWRGAVVAVLPVTAYAILYLRVFGRWPDGDFPILPHIGTFVGPHPNLTPHPDWLHYPKLLLRGTGLPVAAFAVFSLPLLMRPASRLAVFAWYGVYLALHMATFRIGLTVSAGYQRFLLPLAPAFALAAALGLGTLIDKARASLERLLKARAVAWGTSYALLALCVAAVLVFGFRVRPVPLDAEGAAAAEAAAWLHGRGLADGQIVATHVYVHYFLPGHLNAFHPGGDPEALWEKLPALSALPPGTVAVWDSHYSDDPAYGLPYAALTAKPTQWTMLKEFDVTIKGTYADDDARMVIFRKEQP
jgi:hypothetical protein